MQKKFPLALLLAAAGASGATTASAATFNYAEALQKGIWFYDVQRSGKLPASNRVSWRGDSALDDGKREGVDLSGGWYDAGDHVKFGLPAAYTATLLAWSLIEDEEAYVNSEQYRYALDNLRWGTDYFIKAHTAPNELWGQVGDGGKDHAYWGAPEVMQVARDMVRPAYKIDAKCPGSDLAGQTAAALAASSIVFKKVDAAYADKLLKHARELYSFADTYRGKYSDCIKDASGFYNSFSGYQDELVWGAAWLYQATGDEAYLAKAEKEYDKLSFENGTELRSYRWTLSWDDTAYGSYVLLSKITDKAKYKQDAERWLDYWTSGYGSQRITYTPGGLAYLDQWGALRYASATAMMAFYYGDVVRQDGKTELADKYYHFAKRQIDYMLGANPRQSSYVVGFGKNPPLNPHHRAAHGSWGNNIMNPSISRHTLYGALVGGPDTADEYVDDRGNYVRSEVALDYNASFVGALARLTSLYGGEPLMNFPVKETPRDEYYVAAKVNASGRNFIEVAGILYNHTAWPARISQNLSYRYYVDLSELIAAGIDPQTDIAISTAYSQGSSVSKLKPYDRANGIYYVEIYFTGVGIAPVGESESRREVQFRMALAHDSDEAWDSSNDFSFGKMQAGSSPAVNVNMPVYDNGQKVWGEEP
jgi:hypothetical protein